ncbi:MAG: hypothetical protein ACJKTH_01490 [Patescibacteria group bacterium UBA2163]|tara:strand:- start:40 stop:426 length:387 start_codon:yes stop_codon:yes gene_type:complete
MPTVQKNTYIPGVCNIGPEEIKKRKQAGWIGLIATIALWALFIWLETPPIWRLTLFFPAMMSATGFLQAYTHFCVYFGFANLFNFGDVGKTDSVSQAEFRTKDRKKAWQIILFTISIGAIVSFLAYYL